MDDLVEDEAAKKERESAEQVSIVEAGLSETELQRFKVILLEYDVLESTGNMFLPELDAERWKYVLEFCKSRHKRAKQYKYWAERDWQIKKKKKKQIERQRIHMEREKHFEKSKEEGTFIPRPRIMLRLLDATMNTACYHNLAHSMTHGIPLVFDFGFDDKMGHKELKHVAKQVLYCHGWNKYERDPFHMHWCSCPDDGWIMKHVRDSVRMNVEELPITTTEKSYMELFPQKDLVYLSPHAPTTLREFNPDDVYIIGGLVDMSSQGPLSYARAKQQRIRSAKLPLDQFLPWGLGNKSLTLDQMMRILIEMKHHNDWRRAFEIAVPKRKLRI